MTAADLHLVLEKEQEAMVCFLFTLVIFVMSQFSGLNHGISTGQSLDQRAVHAPPADSLGRVHRIVYVDRTQ